MLLGNTGQLGWELERTLSTVGELLAVDYPAIDFTKLKELSNFVLDYRPDIIFNAAAYTAVDKAEKEQEIAKLINTDAPSVLAESAKKIGSLLIHYSTDYVFDGTKGSDYLESDIPLPLNFYGRSKFEGEKSIEAIDSDYLIFRTSWVYSTRKDSFLLKVKSWAKSQEKLRIVSDQIGNPTWARSLAEISTQILLIHRSNNYSGLRDRKGLYHLAGDGSASRFDWAKEIIDLDPEKEFHKVKEIEHALTAEFPTPAQRPLYSALNCNLFKNTFNLSLPDWKQAIKLAMSQ